MRPCALRLRWGLSNSRFCMLLDLVYQVGGTCSRKVMVFASRHFEPPRANAQAAEFRRARYFLGHLPALQPFITPAVAARIRCAQCRFRGFTLTDTPGITAGL